MSSEVDKNTSTDTTMETHLPQNWLENWTNWIHLSIHTSAVTWLTVRASGFEVGMNAKHHIKLQLL